MKVRYATTRENVEIVWQYATLVLHCVFSVIGRAARVLNRGLAELVLKRGGSEGYCYTITYHSRNVHLMNN